MFITRNDEKLKFYGAGMRGGNVLGCVAGMCWDAWRECAAKCVPEKRETAGMHGRNVLQNACQKNGMSLCKKCYIEPVEVRARKAGNCWDAWLRFWTDSSRFRRV